MSVFAALGLVLLSFLGVTVFVALVAWGWSLVEAENTRRLEALKAAAQRFGGRIHDGFWSGKSLRFEVDGVPAELSSYSGSENSPPYTKLHFEWGGPPLRVAPEGAWASFTKLLGADDLQIGHADFDDTFLIQGQPDWARKVLIPSTRDLLTQLHTLGASGGLFGKRKGITLDVTPGGVIFRCPRNHVRNRDDLLVFLETSVAVLGALRASAEGGVQVSVAEVVKAGKCPVCSDAAGDLSKHCQGCNAAYHPECWDYLGGCAVFGCEDRYRQQEPRAKGW